MRRRRQRGAVFDLEGLPPRQKAIVGDVKRFGFLSVRLVAEFCLGSARGGSRTQDGGKSAARKGARRELAGLEKRGILKSFTMPGFRGRGAPEKVCCLASTRIPKNLTFIPHQLATVRLALILRAGCSRHPKKPYSFDFLVEHEDARKTRKDDLRPDLVFCVGSSKGRGLYLAEVDLGNESLTSSDRKRATICRKLERYSQLPGYKIKKYSRAFDQEFHGFRAIVAVRHRFQSILKACRLVGTGDVVGVADFKDITPANVLASSIWTVPGLSMRKEHRLNWHPDRRR